MKGSEHGDVMFAFFAPQREGYLAANLGHGPFQEDALKTKAPGECTAEDLTTRSTGSTRQARRADWLESLAFVILL